MASSKQQGQQQLAPKLTYRPRRKLEVFYTGGAARVTRDGKRLVCTCGEQVQVRRHTTCFGAAQPSAS